jgi:hypothetical protein
LGVGRAKGPSGRHEQQITPHLDAGIIPTPRRPALHLLLLLTLLAACDKEPLSPFPSNAVAFTPPARYAAWWQLTEACSGLTGNLAAVDWYVVPNTNEFTLEGQGVNGAWYQDGNRIALGDSEMLDGTLVRHEMLHALLQSGAHPRNQFLANCSDIVVCIEKCVSDAGGPPDTSDAAPLLGGDSLAYGLLVVPNEFSASADSGWTTVTLTATNRQPIAANLPPPFEAAYGYRPLKGWEPYDNYGIQQNIPMTFAPAGAAGSTRRVVFDAQVIPPSTMEQYRILGNFDYGVAPPATVTVLP